MAEFPALPIWTDALLGDTYHLSPAEFGAYMRLLICAWRTSECALPNDDKKLGRMVGDQRNWPKWRPVVMAFWDLGKDDLWRQKRLTSERKFVSTSRAKKVKAGRASALKRKETGATPVPTDGQQPTPTPTPKIEEETPSPVSGTESPPDRIIPTQPLPPAEKSANGQVIELKEAKPEKQYAFQGEMFRITVKDFQKWRRSYWAIPDLMAMLEHIDLWYANAEDGKLPKRIFFAVAGWLNNEHQKRRDRGATMPRWLLKEQGKC